MTINIPYGLNKTSLKYPHRMRAGGRGKKMSPVAHSFARGNLTEIKYWQDTGVLDEAMDGKTRYRGDYTKDLMLNLSHYLGSVLTLNDGTIQEYDNVLTYLWERGAKEHTNLYPVLLPNLVCFDMAEKLIEVGVSPWQDKAGSQGDVLACWNEYGRRNHNGMEAILAIMGNLQSGTWYEKANYHLNAKISDRAIRWIQFAGASESSLRDCLGIVAMNDFSPRRGISDEKIKQLWPVFRDKLIDMGATANLDDGDALYRIFLSGPSSKMPAYEVAAEASRRADEIRKNTSDDKYYPYEDLTPLTDDDVEEIGRELLEKRTSVWNKTSQEWLGALKPVLQKPISNSGGGSTWFRNSTSASIWTKLLDMPNGMELAKQIGGLMVSRGQALPWTGREGAMSASGAYILASTNGKRSVRKLAQVVELSSDPKLNASNVSGRWISEFTEQVLEIPRLGDDANDMPPSEEIEEKKVVETKLRGRGHSRGREEPPQPKTNLPTPTEMSLLLDLAGSIDPMKGWNFRDDEQDWILGFLCSLPKKWSAQKTSEDERRDLLDVLAQRGVLKAVVGLGKGLIDTLEYQRLGQSEEAREKAESSFRVASSTWYSAWKYQTKLLDEVSEAFGRLSTPDTSSQRVLALTRAWAGALGELPTMYSYPHDDVQALDLRLKDQARETFKIEPDFLHVVSCQSTLGLKKITKYDYWNTITSALMTIERVIDLGWKPTPEQISDLIDDATRLTSEIPDRSLTEDDQALLIGRLASLGGKKKNFIPMLLERLFEQEVNGQSRKSWVYLASVAVENKWDPTIPQDISPSEESLRLYVKNGVRRRDLAQIAKDTVRQDVANVEQETPSSRSFRM